MLKTIHKDTARRYQSALELNPSYASARVWRAEALIMRLRFDEGVAEVERAAALDPLSLITQTQVGWIYNWAGRLDDAIAQFRKVLAVDPEYPWALVQLGGSLMQTGRLAEAVEVLKALRHAHGDGVRLRRAGWPRLLLPLS